LDVDSKDFIWHVKTAFDCIRFLQPELAVEILEEELKTRVNVEEVVCLVSLRTLVVESESTLSFAATANKPGARRILSHSSVRSGAGTRSLDESSHCIRKVEPFLVGGHLELFLLPMGKTQSDVVVLVV
jgi:hypothetical protein